MAGREIADSIAYCGLVCAFCHLSQDRGCGGCRSAQNSCGKHASPEGCFQYNCCRAKGLKGCWECAEFPCGRDMFAPGHGNIRLKAFVRCAKEDGLDELAMYLERNAANGIQYHRDGKTSGDYDGLESEEQVLQLLRTGGVLRSGEGK